MSGHTLLREPQERMDLICTFLMTGLNLYFCLFIMINRRLFKPEKGYPLAQMHVSWTITGLGCPER